MSGRCTSGSSSACSPLAKQSEEAQRDSIRESWSALDGTRAIRLEQADHGWLSRGRVASARGARALARERNRRGNRSRIASPVTGSRARMRIARSSLPDTRDADRSRPYPFYLAYALEGSISRSSDRRASGSSNGSGTAFARSSFDATGKTYLWSRGDELVTDRFPEIAAAAEFLPDGTVIDGEIMPWANGAPLPFAQLQRRIGRTKLGPKILADVPVVLIAYDLLEVDGRDVRTEPLVGATRGARDARRQRARRVAAPALACRRRAHVGQCARSACALARAARRGADAQAARLARTAWAVARAVGGSGRCSPSPSMR